MHLSTKTKWIILVGLILLVGGALLILGFYLSGADILGWFKSKYAFIVYFFVFLYFSVAISFGVKDWVAK